MEFDLYDFMANCIMALHAVADTKFFESYNAMTHFENERINDMIIGTFPFLFDNSGVMEITAEQLSDKYLLSQLRTFLNKCKQKADYKTLLRLISKLDLALARRINYFKLKVIREDTCICGMNHNIDTTQIQLLPRCKCAWAHQSRDYVSSYTINNYLTHSYYISCDKLKPFQVTHTYIEPIVSYDDYISIGVTPLFGWATLSIDYLQENHVNLFNITDLTAYEEIRSCCIEQLRLARQKGINILVYPEMLGSEALIEDIKRELRKFPEDTRLKYPSLIICPTYWKDNRNVCVVLNEIGEEVVRQEKQFPFAWEKDSQEYYENIYPDHKIHLIHCDGIGRIAIMICKDALNRDYLNHILNKLKATLIIVPSFSTGHHDFEEILQMCRPYDCAAIWINTCSAAMIMDDTEKLKTIGFINKIGKSPGIPNGTFPVERQINNCIDGNSCRQCLFVDKLYYN